MTMVQDAPAPSKSQAVASAFRTLLVHVEPEAEAAPRLDAAVVLARKLDAALVGVGAEMIQSLGVSDPYGMLEGQWLVEMRSLVQTNLKRAEEAFKAKAAGLESRWIALEDLPAPAIARLSRGADLIIAGGAPIKDGDTYRTADTAELVLLSGRPVLVAPPNGGKLRAEGVVVAWKDTREARRALADSLPFLKAAEDVLILEVCEEDRFADAEIHTFAVVEHLRRHGVEARAKVLMAPQDRAVAELNIAAQEIGADLIVAGGYGHSRLGEWVFGGVTRDLLRHPERFVLLSH